MDSFDDLLDSSRSIPVLDNPFEDPFARPRSPDPWSTFSQQPAHEEEQIPASEYPREPLSPVQQLPASHSSGAQSSDAAAAPDPLDAKAANEEDEPEDIPSLRRHAPDPAPSLPQPAISQPPKTPTETLPTSAAEPEAQPKAQPKPQSPPPPPRAVSPPPTSLTESERTPTPTLRRSPSPKPPSPKPASLLISEAPSPKAALTQSPPPKPARVHATVVSPLESGPVNGQSSFTTLALGGEMPGWQGAFGSSTSLTSRDDLSGGEWAEQGDAFVNGIPPSLPLAREGSDDDDDVPIAVHSAVPIGATRGPDIQPMFVITVGDPQKVGDPVRPFITYTVQTRTSSPLYRRSTFSVLRRYSDFLWLYETLSINNPGVIVPPVPEKQQYGRFQDTFVENRRAALNKCIQKIANHPSLRDDPDLKLFLESDSFVLDIKHRKAEIAHERGGLMASIGSTLVGPRFYETDEWFDNKKAYLDSLESQLRGLVKSIDMVSKQRNEVAISMADFADNVAALSACDMGKQLSLTLGALADVQRKAKELQDLQAREDVSTIMSTVDEYARLVNSVRLAFSSRVRLYASWQNADGDLRKTQVAHDKARRQGRIPSDRLGSSLSEIAEVERRAMEAKQEFDNASKMIKSELTRFEQERVEDFKNALVAFLNGMVAKQKEIIQSWENYQESLLKRMGISNNSSTTSPSASLAGQSPV
ncbi:Vps5-domain-containing protein [Ramaria rubella]|nr:Vps5-domain-containing protein [Ramaria rubella]